MTPEELPAGGPAASRVSAPRSHRAWVWLGLVLLLAVGGTARSAGIADRSFWYDETLSWRFARMSPAGLPHGLKASQHPPLYFAVLYGWMRAVGESPAAIRSLSLVFGVAAIAVTYALTRDLARTAGGGGLGPAGTGVLAAALVALSPMQVRYGFEARMYTMGTFLALVSGWALIRAARGGSPWWWVAYTAACVAFVYTHNFALLALAAHGLFVSWWCCERAGGRWWLLYRDPVFRRAALCWLAVGAAFVPWLPVFRAQLANAPVREWMPPLTTKWQVYDAIYKMFVDPETWPSRAAAAWSVVLVAPFVAAAAARGKWADWFALTVGSVPVALTVVAAEFGTRLFHYRYFVLSQPFLLVAAALAVARVPRPGAAVGLAVGLVAASGWACWEAWTRLDVEGHPGFRGAAECINADRRPGELVVATSPIVLLPIHYHLDDRSGAFILSTARSGEKVFGPAVDPSEGLDVNDLLGRTGRVWVVTQVGEDRRAFVPSTWRGVWKGRFAEIAGLANLEVIVYELPAP